MFYASLLSALLLPPPPVNDDDDASDDPLLPKLALAGCFPFPRFYSIIATHKTIKYKNEMKTGHRECKAEAAAYENTKIVPFCVTVRTSHNTMKCNFRWAEAWYAGWLAWKIMTLSSSVRYPQTRVVEDG